MITVIKLSPSGEEKTRYPAEIVERFNNGVRLQAFWRNPARDLGYVCFEPGDRFTEYFYVDRWFNIFDIATAQGVRKGWYCNVAAPAIVSADCVEQIDLCLDVWVDPQGRPLILDEDEFAADATLSAEQRSGAKQGLRNLLQRIAAGEEPFSYSSLAG